MNSRELLEYFIDGAEALYMTRDGIIHLVSTDHISQVIEDFDLNDEITSHWNSQFGEDPKWDKDCDDISCWVGDFCLENKILFLVLDKSNRVVYVRGHKNDPNPTQRKSLINFCISRRCELEYDPQALA